MLSLYCKLENIHYKQGMNELLVPFLLLMRQGLSKNEAYTFFQRFIKIMLPTMFIDEVLSKQTFRPLQGLFVIFRLLLRYHSPSLTALFDLHEITPDYYVTSWFLTIFSSRTSDLDSLFALWEQVIEEKDRLFTCYLAVAFLEFFKSEILSKDPTVIPQKIQALRLSTTAEVMEIV